MSGSTPVHHRGNGLGPQIEQIRRAQRNLERSVDASGHALGAAVYKPSPVHWRFRLLFPLSLVVALAAVLQLLWTPADAPRRHVAPRPVIQSEPAASNRAEVSLARVPADHTLVIHVHATRVCRVRVVVDGTPLEWKTLRPGDEFFSRPREQLLLESDDGGALSATVNGVSVSLGPDGRAMAIRFTTEHPYPQFQSVP